MQIIVITPLILLAITDGVFTTHSSITNIIHTTVSSSSLPPSKTSAIQTRSAHVRNEENPRQLLLPFVNFIRRSLRIKPIHKLTTTSSLIDSGGKTIGGMFPTLSSQRDSTFTTTAIATYTTAPFWIMSKRKLVVDFSTKDTIVPTSSAIIKSSFSLMPQGKFVSSFPASYFLPSTSSLITMTTASQKEITSSLPASDPVPLKSVMPTASSFQMMSQRKVVSSFLAQDSTSNTPLFPMMARVTSFPIILQSKVLSSISSDASTTTALSTATTTSLFPMMPDIISTSLSSSVGNTTFQITWQDEAMSKETILVTVYLLVLLLLSVVCNGTIGCVFYKKPQLLTVSNNFVLNLACCQLGLTLLILPFSVACALGRGDWMLSATWCRIQSYLLVVMLVVLHYSLMAISLDRNYAIVNSLRYPYIFTQRLGNSIIAAMWVLGFTVGLPPLFGWGAFKLEVQQSLCSVDWQADTTYTFLFLGLVFLLPLVVQCWCYLSIFRAALGHTKRSSAKVFPSTTTTTSTAATTTTTSGTNNTATTASSSDCEDATQTSSVPLRSSSPSTECKAVKTLILIATAYLVCWTVFVVVALLKWAGEDVNPSTDTAASTLLFLSCLLNPLIYGFMNRVTRFEIRKFWLPISQRISGRPPLPFTHDNADEKDHMSTSTWIGTANHSGHHRHGNLSGLWCVTPPSSNPRSTATLNRNFSKSTTGTLLNVCASVRYGGGSGHNVEMLTIHEETEVDEDEVDGDAYGKTRASSNGEVSTTDLVGLSKECVGGDCGGNSGGVGTGIILSLSAVGRHFISQTRTASLDSQGVGRRACDDGLTSGCLAVSGQTNADAYPKARPRTSQFSAPSRFPRSASSPEWYQLRKDIPATGSGFTLEKVTADLSGTALTPTAEGSCGLDTTCFHANAGALNTSASAIPFVCTRKTNNGKSLKHIGKTEKGNTVRKKGKNDAADFLHQSQTSASTCEFLTRTNSVASPLDHHRTFVYTDRVRKNPVDVTGNATSRVSASVTTSQLQEYISMERTATSHSFGGTGYLPNHHKPNPQHLQHCISPHHPHHTHRNTNIRHHSHNTWNLFSVKPMWNPAGVGSDHEPGRSFSTTASFRNRRVRSPKERDIQAERLNSEFASTVMPTLNSERTLAGGSNTTTSRNRTSLNRWKIILSRSNVKVDSQNVANAEGDIEQ